jgi:hypothetical protein
MKDKQKLPGITDRPLSDMDCGGVYFEKTEVQKIEESVCQYSGLPSVKSYEKVQEEFFLGHS